MYLKYVNGSNALLNSILWEYVLKNDEKRENYPPTRVKHPIKSFGDPMNTRNAVQMCDLAPY